MLCAFCGPVFVAAYGGDNEEPFAPEVGLVAAGDLSVFAAFGGLLGLSVASRKLAPEVGFEPTTNRLTADRSTTELLRTCAGTGQKTKHRSACQEDPRRDRRKSLFIGPAYWALTCENPFAKPREGV